MPVTRRAMELACEALSDMNSRLKYIVSPKYRLVYFHDTGIGVQDSIVVSRSSISAW